MKRTSPHRISTESEAGGFPPAPESAPGDTPPASSPPPAAALVAAGGASEGDAGEIVKLRRERDDLEKGKKAVEVRASELEDENRRLKKAGVTPPAAKKKKSWLEGATFFDDDDD